MEPARHLPSYGRNILWSSLAVLEGFDRRNGQRKKRDGCLFVFVAGIAKLGEVGADFSV